jgi:hypothetical protein
MKEFNWRPNGDCHLSLFKDYILDVCKFFLKCFVALMISPCKRALGDYFSAFSAVAAAVRQCLRGMKWTTECSSTQGQLTHYFESPFRSTFQRFSA